jgi:branched-chain amino acid transport system permease protein
VRYGVGALIALAVLTLPMWMSSSKMFIATETMIFGIIAVSLVLLTGWAGHVSLGQMAFAAIGGAVSGWVTQTQGYDLALGVLLGGAVGAAVAVAVGIPAARAGGLTLAITTLSLSAATLYWLLNPEFFEWVPRGRFREDPVLFGRLTLDDETTYYFISLAALVFAVAMALGIRRSRTGRVLIALRENPRAAESYGVNSIRTVLSAFAFSGFLAAIAGVLFVHHQHGLSNVIGGNPFAPESSLRVFAIVVIGGLGSIPGSLLGTLYVFTMQYYMLPEYRFLATGFGLLALLLILPGGIGAGFAEARDAGLRWVAKRRNILVPSLVADRRVEGFHVTEEMAEAVAEVVERPELEDLAETRG